MTPLIANLLAILSIAPLALLPVVWVFCYFECAKCREQRERMRVDMQLRIGREMGQMQRRREQAEQFVIVQIRKLMAKR
jgi:hypothetical protein